MSTRLLLKDPQETFFTIAMWWRIGYSFVRLFLGLMLFRVVGLPVSDIFSGLMQHELTQDPNDLLIQTATPFVQHFPMTVTYFIACYFIFWGIIDVVLSAQILRKKLWAFPVSIVLISLFVIYEIIRFFHTHSLILLSVIIIDIIIILLIAREYETYKDETLEGNKDNQHE